MRSVLHEIPCKLCMFKMSERPTLQAGHQDQYAPQAISRITQLYPNLYAAIRGRSRWPTSCC